MADTTNNDAGRTRHGRGGRDANGAATLDGALRTDFRALQAVIMVEAANRGSVGIEAEHMLLGLLFDRNGAGSKALAQAGLTYQAFDEALRSERAYTLEAIGLMGFDAERLAATPHRRMGRARFSTSAKEAWQRASAAHRARRSRGQRWTDIDFIVAILGAQYGTVPRALDRAGFDRAQLVTRLQALIA